MNKKSRNCFVSYHHKNDQKYVDELRSVIRTIRVSDYSLKEDIGHYKENYIYNLIRSKMRTCSVTVILIGKKTGHRKWVDWEIWASLRKYTHPTNKLKSFKPNGLLGIYLPDSSHSVPDRLQDNIDSGYAVSMNWRNLERDFESRVNHAFWSRTKIPHKINNTRPQINRDYKDFLGFRV